MEAEFAGYVFLWIVIGAVFGCIGYAIGSVKEAEGVGAILGFLFGPIGAILAAFPDHRRECANCGTRMAAIAKICPACGTAGPRRATGHRAYP